MVSKVSLSLGAVRDGFVVLLPLTFFGVLASLLQHLPLPAYRLWMTDLWGPLWPEHIGTAVKATHGVFGLALAVAVAVQLSRALPRLPEGREPLPPLTVGLSALMNFMLCVLSQGPLSFQRLGHGGMLLGMGVGLATAWLLHSLSRRRRLSRSLVPYATEITFYHALRATPLVILAGLLVLAGFQLTHLLVPELDHHLLAPVAQWALTRDDGAWWLTALASLLNHGVWLTGVHGGHFLDRYAMDLFMAPGPSFDTHLASRQLLDIFVLLGGSGATVGLVLAVFMAVRDGPQRRLAQLSVLPSAFNINETLIYGLPIALNPAFMLPFVLVPLLLSLMALAAQQMGWLPPLQAQVPWTTPPLISGWLVTGSWRGAALQAVEIALSTAIYLPFVKRAEQQRRLRQAQDFEATTEALLSNEPWALPAVRRVDQVGLIARGLLQDLRAGLVRGDFSLVYQPQHDLCGRVVGLEALLRWRHPQHGPLPPMVAVMLAEQGRDIHQLGDWVLAEACACQARLKAQGLLGLTMSVNLSPTQLTDPKLPDRLAALLAEHGLAPDALALEITESLAIQNGPAVDQTLSRLSALGLRLAMDDFGMGHSSLLHLRRFRVHAIKIDGSLTREVLSSDTSADIIRSIASLGRAQQAHVVAEFVETSAQREALQALGCDHFQGYLMSPPLAEAACVAYLAAQRAAMRQR